MSTLEPLAQQWLSRLLQAPFEVHKHVHSNQDDVYRISSEHETYYLKISTTLRSEYDNLNRIEKVFSVPKVINYHESEQHDFLLLSELPGKNLVELIDEWSHLMIVETFAKAVRQFHAVDPTIIFPKANANQVILHGDMSLPNIIIGAGNEVSYIDFGQMYHGSPEVDLADAIWSLQRNIGPEYGNLFLEHYGPVTITPKIQQALEYRYKP